MSPIIFAIVLTTFCLLFGGGKHAVNAMDPAQQQQRASDAAGLALPDAHSPIETGSMREGGQPNDPVGTNSRMAEMSVERVGPVEQPAGEAAGGTQQKQAQPAPATELPSKRERKPVKREETEYYFSDDESQQSEESEHESDEDWKDDGLDGAELSDGATSLTNSLSSYELMKDRKILSLSEDDEGLFSDSEKYGDDSNDDGVDSKKKMTSMPGKGKQKVEEMESSEHIKKLLAQIKTQKPKKGNSSSGKAQQKPKLQSANKSGKSSLDPNVSPSNKLDKMQKRPKMILPKSKSADFLDSDEDVGPSKESDKVQKRPKMILPKSKSAKKTEAMLTMSSSESSSVDHETGGSSKGRSNKPAANQEALEWIKNLDVTQFLKNLNSKKGATPQKRKRGGKKAESESEDDFIVSSDDDGSAGGSDRMSEGGSDGEDESIDLSDLNSSDVPLSSSSDEKGQTAPQLKKGDSSGGAQKKQPPKQQQNKRPPPQVAAAKKGNATRKEMPSTNAAKGKSKKVVNVSDSSSEDWKPSRGQPKMGKSKGAAGRQSPVKGKSKKISEIGAAKPNLGMSSQQSAKETTRQVKSKEGGKQQEIVKDKGVVAAHNQPTASVEASAIGRLNLNGLPPTPTRSRTRRVKPKTEEGPNGESSSQKSP